MYYVHKKLKKFKNQKFSIFSQTHVTLCEQKLKFKKMRKIEKEKILLTYILL
jgi:hypothetical protein